MTGLVRVLPILSHKTRKGWGNHTARIVAPTQAKGGLEWAPGAHFGRPITLKE